MHLGVLYFAFMDTKRDPGLERAASAAGGITSLSLKLGRSRGAASQWRRIPAELVLKVEDLTGVSRHDLRPDLYPRDEKAEAA